MNGQGIGAFLGMDGACLFTVWAPTARSMELRIEEPVGQTVPMEMDESGYWRVGLTDIEPGTMYRYIPEGGVPAADPASFSQPLGVHGASCIIDHNNFTWHDDNWKVPALNAMVIYEIHTGCFSSTGTFDAIIPRLDELKRTGISTIELMPVAQFPGGRNWGYDGVYPFAVQDTYGGPDGLKRLVDACHGTGIAVLLDVVYNHLGPEGNYLGNFAPYFTDRYRTPWGQAVNFDGEYSHGVRNYFIENALYWFRFFHVDGLRLDAVHGIYDMGARHILAEMRDAVKSYSHEAGRTMYLVAESDLNDSRIVSPGGRGGYALDAQWSDDFHHSVHALLTGERRGYYTDFGKQQHLVKALADGCVYDGRYSTYRKRVHGNSFHDVPGGRLVYSIQNHDQVGNRMTGDRLSSLVDFEALKLAAGTLLTAPAIPLLFMGEEYGETRPFLYCIDFGDQQLVRAVREGRRREFGSLGWKSDPPDPASEDTFAGSVLDWDSRYTGRHSVMLAYYTELLRIRKGTGTLRFPCRRNISVSSNGQGVVVMERNGAHGGVRVLMNYSGREVEFESGARGERWIKLFDSVSEEWQGPGSTAGDIVDGRSALTLRPYNFIIFKVEE